MQVQVDFDDITSWEYLFKTYWVTLKEQLSLTMKDLTHAKKPWKGVVCKPQLSHTVANGNVSIIPNKISENLEINKPQEVPNDRLTTAHSTVDNHVGKSEDGSILSKNNNIKKPTVIAEKTRENPSIEMPKCPESHTLVKEDSQNNFLISEMEVDGNNFDQLKGLKNKNQDNKKHEERETQNILSKYAAIDVHNMSLIYLRRNMIENLIEDKENFQDNVVGSIVRIRISSEDQKPDVYRLVQVVGMLVQIRLYI